MSWKAVKRTYRGADEAFRPWIVMREGDTRGICDCWSEEDAKRIAYALNSLNYGTGDKEPFQSLEEKVPSIGKAPSLADTDPMPWGRHKGVPMQDVPASYMFWLWAERGLENNKLDPVADYIRRNLSAFEQEYPDRIWRK